MPLKLTTYYHGSDIPELPGNNTFHSIELFHIYEATPGIRPFSSLHRKPKSLSPSYWQQYERAPVCSRPPLSSAVRFMEQESILMKLSTKNLSLVRCCNG